MGCFQMKNLNLKDRQSSLLLPIKSIKNSEFCQIDSSSIFKIFSNLHFSYFKKGLLNFQICFSDLCQEKTGIIQNDYILFNPPIGKGSFGEVRLALHKSTGLKRAIKIILKDICPIKKQKKLIKEIEILKSLVNK